MPGCAGWRGCTSPNLPWPDFPRAVPPETALLPGIGEKRQERRAALLDRLAGAKVPRELAAMSPTELDARAVRQLARDATTPTTLRALAPLDQLTPRLAAQLGLVPERFRTPGLLSILNRLDLSRDFWGKLEANLASIPADLAGSIMGRLRRARSTGGFFDAANAAWALYRASLSR